MENPSADKARIVLENFEKEQTKANAQVMSAMIYDGMPKGSSKGDGSENTAINRSDADEFCKHVEQCIDLVAQINKEYGMILRDLYLNYVPAFKKAVEMNISDSTLYRKRIKSLEKFSEICPDEVYEYIISVEGMKNE